MRPLTEIQTELSRLAGHAGELRAHFCRLINELETDHCQLPLDPEMDRAIETAREALDLEPVLSPHLRTVPRYMRCVLSMLVGGELSSLEDELRSAAAMTDAELRELFVPPVGKADEQKGRDRVEKKRDWQDRVEELRDSLVEAGIAWNPWQWNAVIRVRRGSHLPPDLVADMKSSLEMLRAIVARTTRVEELREFLRQCEDNARRADPALAERWLELAERASRTGEVYLEEADALKVEELGERVFRIDAVDPEEAWPEAGPSSPGLGRMETDRGYAVILREPERRPAAALRSLGALVRAWERGDLEPE